MTNGPSTPPVQGVEQAQRMSWTASQQSQSMSTSSPNTVQDLRHMTSNSDLLTPSKDSRRPAKLSTGNGSPSRLGARSPNEIPSSPSSIHSSSSAIFERDIEPLPCSLFASSTGDFPHTPTNPLNHHSTNALVMESSIPAVLSSAATALADDANYKDSSMNIAVIAPTSSTPQMSPVPLGHGVQQQTRSMSIPVSSANSTFGGSVVGSRSPSPTRRNFSAHHHIGNASPEGSRPAMIERNSTGPLPPGAFVGSRSAASSSPSPPSLSPLATAMPLPGPAMAANADTHTMSGLQQATTQSKRLSFISYNDLLNSAPLSAVPLSTIVSPPTNEPPPHIPAVIGSANGNIATAPESMGEEGGEWIGGEWEREGFGRGLESRLDELLSQGQAPSLHMTA